MMWTHQFAEIFYGNFGLDSHIKHDFKIHSWQVE